MWRKEGKNEAFSLRASRSSFSNLCKRSEKECERTLFFLKIVQSKKERKETAKRRELSFFCPTHNFPLFCGHFFPLTHSLCRSLSVELYHPRKYYSHHERQRFDVYEDDTNDDVLLLHILFFVFFFFFFFETVEANWTGRREKKERFEIFNIIIIVGGTSG